MKIQTLADKLQKVVKNLIVCLSEPEACVHGIMYFDENEEIVPDMIYVVFEGSMPRRLEERRGLTQIIWLAGEAAVPSVSEKTNYIVCREPGLYTKILNEAGRELGNDYKYASRMYSMSQSVRWQGTVEDLMVQGTKALQLPILYFDLVTDTVVMKPSQEICRRSYPHFYNEVKNREKELKWQLLACMDKGERTTEIGGMTVCFDKIRSDNYDIGLIAAFSGGEIDEFTNQLFSTLVSMAERLADGHSSGEGLLRSGTSFLVNDMITHPNYPPIMLKRVLEAFHFPAAGHFVFSSMGFADQKSASTLKFLTEDIGKWIENVLWTVHGGTIVLFIALAGRTQMEEILDVFRFLSKKYGVHIGVSQIFMIEQEVYSYFQQSRTALSYAGRITGAGFEHYIMYDMIQQVDFLSKASKCMNLTEYCSVDILRLTDYDRDHGSDLCQTLAIYLNCFGDGIFAAKKLGIHKNSLYYRLGLIKKILGNDLSDGETNYTYMFTFRVLQILGRFNPIDM